MYALPTFTIRSSIAIYREGTIVKLPVELRTSAQIEFYKFTCRDGWNVCPQGFHVYAKHDDYGNLLVIPGLIVSGRKNSSKRFYEKKLELTDAQVIDFMKSLIDEARRVEVAKQQEISLLIHDLRGFSSAIYNSAEEAKTYFERDDRQTAIKRIESVIAAQTLLSIRIDLLDFEANQIALDVVDKIAVFKKVDKVIRCFRSKARAKHVSIDLAGPSKKRTVGPAIFELIVYSLIENAIKYSPSRKNIKVAVRDHAQDISISVKSVGPKISRSERTRIFEKGFRAKQAEQTSQAGTGLGLHSARVLLENHFHGTITVHQSGDPELLDGVTYLDTEFEIVVPEEL